MPIDPRDQIATIIADYRRGAVTPLTAAHVDRWIHQFPAKVRDPLLAEMVHVLNRSYVSKDDVTTFLKQMMNSKKLAGNDPAAFWRGVSFLRLQQAGDSQRDMLALFDDLLNQAYGLTTVQCGADPHTYLYLDDGVYSGGRVKNDLSRWIRESAPRKADVAVVVMALHRGGQYHAKGVVEKAAKDVGKEIEVTWWSAMPVEDRKAYTDASDVLRPKIIPVEAETYVARLNYAPVLRNGDNVGPRGFFSSGQARDLVEQEFLKGGVEVRRRCVHLGEQMRPLGSTWLQTTGFGTMFVTYRNIANNAPLVLWAGDPWYPLFPRKTN